MFCCVFVFGNIEAVSKTLIHAGKLIDGKSDLIQSKMSVVIEGNLITDVKEGYLSTTDYDEYIDLRDYTVLPGLMDMHVHFGQEYQSKAQAPIKVER